MRIFKTVFNLCASTSLDRGERAIRFSDFEMDSQFNRFCCLTLGQEKYDAVAPAELCFTARNDWSNSDNTQASYFAPE